MEDLNKAQQDYAQKRAENLDKFNAHLAAEGASKSRLENYVAASHLYAEIVRAKGEQPDVKQVFLKHQNSLITI